MMHLQTPPGFSIPPTTLDRVRSSSDVLISTVALAVGVVAALAVLVS